MVLAEHVEGGAGFDPSPTLTGDSADDCPWNIVDHDWIRRCFKRKSMLLYLWHKGGAVAHIALTGKINRAILRQHQPNGVGRRLIGCVE